MRTLFLFFSSVVLYFSFSKVYAQALMPQVNTCTPCDRSSDCGGGQACINELDTADNAVWEWTIGELSQIPDSSYLTGWDQFEYKNFISYRAVTNGKVYTRNVVNGNWETWKEKEKFLCGGACGEGDYIYSINLIERSGIITYHLVRSSAIYAKSFPASVYTSDIAHLLNEPTGWSNISAHVLGVEQLEPKTPIFTGFDANFDHLGNLNQTFAKYDLVKMEPFIYKRTYANGTWSSWKRIKVWIDPKSGPDILIYSLARPLIVFGIDDYYSPSSKRYIYKVIGYSTRGKEVFRKVASSVNKKGVCKLNTALAIKCGTASPLKCQIDNQAISKYDNKQVGLATNQALIYSASDAIKVADLLAQAQVKFVRRGLHWHVSEQNRGVYWWETLENGQGMFDSSVVTFKAKGLSTLGVITGTPQWASTMPESVDSSKYPPRDIAHWQNFIAKTVERYGSQSGGKNLVTNWEIWNEPNFPEFFKGNSSDYIKLLNAAYTTIHSIDPNAKVWGPTVLLPYNNLTTGEDAYTFVDNVIKQGRFDVFSIHVYADISQQYTITKTIRQKLDAAGKKHIPLAITETNLKIGKEYPYCPTDLNQAEILKQTYACLYKAGAHSVFWFSAKDIAGYPECTTRGGINKSGVLDSNLNPKASYTMLKRIGDFLNK